MSGIRRMQEQMKGRQIRLGGTSNEKSSMMNKSGSTSKGGSSHKGGSKSKGNPSHAT